MADAIASEKVPIEVFANRDPTGYLAQKIGLGSMQPPKARRQVAAMQQTIRAIVNILAIDLTAQFFRIATTPSIGIGVDRGKRTSLGVHAESVGHQRGHSNSP